MAENLGAEAGCRSTASRPFTSTTTGQWQSDFRRLSNTSCRTACGKYIARHLAPADTTFRARRPLRLLPDDASTLLTTETTTLIIAGMATDYCVLFTGADAYARLQIHVA